MPSFHGQVFGQGSQNVHCLVPRAAAEFEVLALMQFDGNAIARPAILVVMLGDLDPGDQAQRADNLAFWQTQAELEKDSAVFSPLDAPPADAWTLVIGANAQRFIRHR